MRAVTITKQGEPVAGNVRVVGDWPEPTAAPGWLIVRTEASGLNHLDLFVGMGVPGVELTYPRVSGSDACGRVESVGEGVDPAWLGRRVVLNGAVPQPYPIHPDVVPAAPARRMIGEHDPGTHAERFTAPAANVLDVGDADPEPAAAFGLSHLTAWRMLVSRAGLRAGQTVLITGTSGGTAQALFNIAKLFGCTTIVTSRRQHHLDRAIELGADHGVLDTGADWSRQVRRLTGKRGVDVCADSVGKALHRSCLKSLARGGTLVTCGATTGSDAVTDLARIFWNELTLVGSTMGDMNEFSQVVSLFRNGSLKPAVDSVHDSADAAAAFARLESGEQFGKVVIRWM
jgi:NADPH:quinone reductase-like Zn-dependent oxidoreductase